MLKMVLLQRYYYRLDLPSLFHIVLTISNAFLPGSIWVTAGKGGMAREWIEGENGNGSMWMLLMDAYAVVSLVGGDVLANWTKMD